MKKRAKYLVAAFMALVAALAVSFACAEFETLSEEEIIALCREKGVDSRCFPQDITVAELRAEKFEITAMEHEYSLWLITSTRQREGVEFGWVEYHLPSNGILCSGRYQEGYQRERQRIVMEEEKGCYYFWSAVEKAEYNRILYGEEARLTFPREEEVQQAAAVDIATHALLTLLGVNEDKTASLLVDAAFYQEDSRCWGITFRRNSVKETIPLEPLYAVVIDASTGSVSYAVDYQKDLVVKGSD